MVKLIPIGWKSSILHKDKGKLGIIEIPSMPVIPGYVNRHKPRIPMYMNIRPVHLLRVSLLRILESNFPGNPL